MHEKPEFQNVTVLDREYIGNAESRLIMGEKNYFTLVSAPIAGKSQIARHLPLMGEKGMDYLMECREEFFDRVGI